MNVRNKFKIGAALLALTVVIPMTAGAEAILHGRVSFDAGGTLVKGAEESDWSTATVNTLILPGDTLWVDNGGTTETEFSGGTFLRMADGSKAEIVSVPPNGTVRGWVGSFYIQRLARSQGAFVFYTPAGAVEVEKDSMVRVDIVGEGITTVSTRWGRAAVRTDAGGTVYAHTGKRVFIETGLLPSEPTPYDRSNEDEFDRWNRERAEFLATGSSQAPASVGITDDTIGVTDLDRYGEWITVDSRPVWRPTVVVDYTPYHHGYWNYVGSVGNVWVGNYPFSYVTSHYGYWDYTPRYGWYWSYDRVWSPAWCATVQYGDYFLWAPVNRYYQPVYPHTSAYFSIGGVSFGYYGTSCVRVSNLYHGPSYVHFATYDPFRRYYSHGNVTVNIWNINTNNRQPHVRVPFNNSVTTVRDYTPRRSIRGATTLFASNRTASERVQRLESTSGRSSFSRADRTGSRSERTDIARIDAGSRTRNVRLEQSAPDYTRATRSNPVSAANTRTRSGSDTVTATSGRGRDGGTRSGAVATREGDTVRSSGTSRGESTGRTRTRDDNVARTDIPARTNTDRSFDSPMRTRTTAPARTRTNVDTGSRGETSVERRTTVPETRSTDRTGSSATSTRTPVRTSVPRVGQAPDRVISRDSGRSADTSGRTVTRERLAPPARTETPSRTESTRSYTPPARTEAPSRTESSRSYTPPARSVAPSRTESSRSYTPPARSVAPSRTESSRSYTPPARSVAPSRTESSRSYTPPTRSVAPSRSESPRNYTPPARTSTPSRVLPSAPSSGTRLNSPSVSSSRGSSSRTDYSAPSRDTSSRSSYSTPNRASSSRTDYSAPSRDTSSRGKISAPSSGRAPVSSSRATSGRGR